MAPIPARNYGIQRDCSTGEPDKPSHDAPARHIFRYAAEDDTSCNWEKPESIYLGRLRFLFMYLTLKPIDVLSQPVAEVYNGDFQLGVLRFQTGNFGRNLSLQALKSRPQPLSFLCRIRGRFPT